MKALYERIIREGWADDLKSYDPSCGLSKKEFLAKKARERRMRQAGFDPDDPESLKAAEAYGEEQMKNWMPLGAKLPPDYDGSPGSGTKTAWGTRTLD